MIKKSRFSLWLLALFALGFFLNLGNPIQAESVNVSASISDSLPPSVPILIEPSDGAWLSDNTPSFKWYRSVDNIALSHYVFYLDGNILYNNIPLLATDNAYYTLSYDGLDDIYTLTPKTGLSDATHTWKVAAVDYVGLKAFSDTWDFTIDTLAPSFILSKIGDTAVNISASNPNSVPSNPIVIFANDATANEPILIANGEANSSVKLTVTIPDDPTQTFTTNIDANGYYELKLGILPRNRNIRLDFIITDRASHISVLEKVYFRIALQYWPTATATATASPTSTPTPTTSKTPSPSSKVKPSLSISVISLSPTPTATPSPSPSKSPTPTGIIPIIPPREIIHEMGSEIVEALPTPTATYIKNLLNSRLWQFLSSAFVLLITGLLYLLSFLLVTSKFNSDISLVLLKRIGTLLLPPIFKHDKNLVFEYGETLASPLVKVELLDKAGQVLDFAITNLQGNFADLAYPRSQAWALRVQDSNFYFPIGDERPSQLEVQQFYQGQWLEGDVDQAILIPTLRAAGQDKLPFLERWRIVTLYILDYPLWFTVVMFLLATAFAMRYQGWCNSLALIFYTILLSRGIYTIFRQKKLFLLVRTADKQQFFDNLVVSFFASDSKKISSLIVPFDFSRSNALHIEAGEVMLTAFARSVAMQKNGVAIGGQMINISDHGEEVTLQITKSQ